MVLEKLARYLSIIIGRLGVAGPVILSSGWTVSSRTYFWLEDRDKSKCEISSQLPTGLVRGPSQARVLGVLGAIIFV